MKKKAFTMCCTYGSLSCRIHADRCKRKFGAMEQYHVTIGRTCN